MSGIGDTLGQMGGAFGLTNPDGSVNFGAVVKTGSSLFGGSGNPTASVTAAPQVTNPSFQINLPNYTKEAEEATKAAVQNTTGTVQFATGDPAKNNTMLYVGIGAAVLVVIGLVLFFVFKKK
jgi:LPXTG-motif cell wall-anchored protein